jgi:hypothetical protein
MVNIILRVLDKLIRDFHIFNESNVLNSKLSASLSIPVNDNVKLLS